MLKAKTLSNVSARKRHTIPRYLAFATRNAPKGLKLPITEQGRNLHGI